MMKKLEKLAGMLLVVVCLLSFVFATLTTNSMMTYEQRN